MNENKHSQSYYNNLASIIFIGIVFFINFAFPIVTMVTAPLNEKMASQREAAAIEDMQEEASDDLSIANDLMPKVLLALCSAFTLNFIVILFYSREQKNDDVQMMSGNCAKFEVTKVEMQRLL